MEKETTDRSYMPPESSLKNLTPFDKLDPEEAKRIRSKGGKASVEKRRYNKTFKQAMEWALSLDAFRGNPDVDAIHDRYPDLNNRDAIAIAATAKAIQTGDIKAFIAIRDTTGELPVQQVNVGGASGMTINIRTLGEGESSILDITREEDTDDTDDE